jgi:ethanolamine ammonia-lyase large subunit
MSFSHSIGGMVWRFDSLRELMAKASPARSGDFLAEVAASSDAERAAAQMTLADVPLKQFLTEALIPYEEDEVTRLIVDSHDRAAFAAVSHLTVGGFRDWLLGDDATEASLKALAPGLTPEMAAAVSKIMRVQDLVLVSQKIRVVTRFRNTTPSACVGACPPGCNPITPPMTRPALPPACWTACCTAMAMP